MAPRATTTEPPALAIEPIDDAAVEASWICKILMQFKTPKGVTCSVLSKPMWPRIDGLPERVAGRVDQWVVTKNKTMRISWQEANGEFKYDIEDLHMLLRPEYGFKLELGPKGEALHLRGAARVEFEATREKETVDIPWMDGAMERTQVWTVEEDPEAVNVDERKQARDKPKLARDKKDINTPFKAWYNAAQSHKQLDLMERYFNARLDGSSHATRKTSRGELVRFCSLMGAIALAPGTPVSQMWKRVKGPKDIYEPAALGRFGIGENRFDTLKRLAGHCYPLNEVGMDASDPWRYSSMPVNCYNEHMAEVFGPGWYLDGTQVQTRRCQRIWARRVRSPSRFHMRCSSSGSPSRVEVNWRTPRVLPPDVSSL